MVQKKALQSKKQLRQDLFSRIITHVIGNPARSKVLANYEMHSLLESTLSIDNGKGGLISEDIFNLVPSSRQWSKSLPSKFSLNLNVEGRTNAKIPYEIKPPLNYTY